MTLKWFGKYVHQSWMVVGLCVGIVAGVIIGMIFRVNYFESVVWVGVIMMVMVVGYLKPRVGVVILAVVAGMMLAFFRIAGELRGEEYVRGLYDYDVVVAGVISGDPETDEGVTKFRFGDLRFGEEGIEGSGSLYITVNRNEGLMRADRVVLEGKLQGGFGTYAGSMYRPKVVKWERPEPGSWVLRLRNWFAERVESVIPEPEVKLGLSYLLGMKTGLSDELSENLRVVGLTHIVVASGAHLAILVEVARKIFGKLSRMAGVLFSVVFVVVFMAMDAVDPQGGDDDDVDAFGMVFGKKSGAVAIDTDGDGGDVDGGTWVYYEHGVAVVVCVVCGNNDARAGFRAVVLWGAEAGICGVDGADDGCSDGDDVTDCAVLLWCGVLD